jgi:Gram-negative bacterial TonB protein C-terminal
VRRTVLAMLSLVVLLPGCRTAAPRAPLGPAAPPDLLKDYVGQLRVLRYQGDEQKVEVSPQTRLAGQCDVAVEVRAATFEAGAARFSLETVGLPAVGGRQPRCKRTLSAVRLLVSGFPAAPEAKDVRPRVDAVLATPEAYLQAMGVVFDREPAGEPVEVASREVDANDAERALARKVTAWPQALLTVEAWYPDPSGRVRQQSQVEIEAIVGTDGRLSRPRIKTALGDVHEKAITRVLPLWRFDPARRGEEPVAARVALQPVLRIY